MCLVQGSGRSVVVSGGQSSDVPAATVFAITHQRVKKAQPSFFLASDGSKDANNVMSFTYHALRN